MLEHEQTLELLKKAREGDENAKEQLVIHNTPLIKSIVKRYCGKYVEYDDLFQLGAMGLIKAINNFSADYNVRFSTYAVPMICGEIKRYIRDDGSVKVSRTTKILGYKINRFIEEFKREKNAEPTLQQIADEFKLEIEEVVFTLGSQHCPVSLYEGNDEDGLRLIDRLAAAVDEDAFFDKMLLSELIERLTPREKEIVLLRYYRDKTQSEIANAIGVSQVQVSRLENKIIDKLKKMLNE